jgi:hypothetical protein
MNDNLVRITNRDSWVAVLIHGLSAEKEICLNLKRVVAKASIPVKDKDKDKDKKKREQKMFDYDGVDTVLGKFSLNPVKKERRAQCKLSLMKKFHSFTVGDLTNARKIIYLADPKNMDKKELYRSFVGINAFESAGYIHKDLKYVDTAGRAVRGWLLRISSKHGSLELKRNLRVDGMGVIIYNGDDLGDPMRYKADVFTGCDSQSVGIGRVVKPISRPVEYLFL